jgi:uncharacterized phage protein (TIGR02218 family)
VKSASAVLAAHLEQEVTALATCWRLTRTDGLVLGFTDHDRDLVIESLTYRAASAYSRSAIASRAGLAVDNLDLEGLLDSDAISEEELRAGRFDRAAVEVFLVNWQALGQGVVRLRRGTLGEVRLQGGLYRAELRGMAQALTAPAVEVYTPECRADLGDHRCQVDLAALTVPGSVASAADRRTFTTSDVTDPLPGASGLYNGGVLSWISGANAGMSMEVKSWDAPSRTLVLFLPMPYPIEVGDAFTGHPGCDKRLATCRDVFANVLNFRGEPFVPGLDALGRYPDAQ